MNYNQWDEVTLSEVTDKIGDGLHGTPKYDDLGEYFFVNGNNLNGKITIDNLTKRVSHSEYLKYKKDLNNTTILLSINGTLGKLAFYNGERVILGKSACYINVKNEVHKKFIYYTLQSTQFLSYLGSHSSGTTIKNLGLKEIRNFSFGLPNYITQKAIANILSSLDDKLELNNNINKNLEELAQTLYKRWFVDFEFPNEDGKPYKSSGGDMVESELGQIPKGWKVEPLGESSISRLISSGINKFEGVKRYIATADVVDTTITSFNTQITYLERPSRANMQPASCSVWFAKMKDSKKLIRVSQSSDYILNKCIFSTGFAGISAPKSFNYIWTYLTTLEFDASKNSLCNGTTMQAINNENINRIKLIVPSNGVLKKFDNIANDIFEKVQLNDIESNKISKLRDELLPRLMNGEIEVPIKE